MRELLRKRWCMCCCNTALLHGATAAALGVGCAWHTMFITQMHAEFKACIQVHRDAGMLTSVAHVLMQWLAPCLWVQC